VRPTASPPLTARTTAAAARQHPTPNHRPHTLTHNVMMKQLFIHAVSEEIMYDSEEKLGI